MWQGEKKADGKIAFGRELLLKEQALVDLKGLRKANSNPKSILELNAKVDRILDYLDI